MTSDEEREVVLQQNDALRERFINRSDYRVRQGPLRQDIFQRLRRCCICLQASCVDQSACRAEFAEWTERKWNNAVDERLNEQGKQLMVIVSDYRT